MLSPWANPKLKGKNNKPRIFCQRRRWNSFVRRRRWRCEQTNRAGCRCCNELQRGPKPTTHTGQHPGFKCCTPAQQPRFITNCDKSPTLLLQRSWRHGCPLSPLLFAPAIEPLAISRRNHPSLPPLLELHTVGERSGYNYKLGQERIHVCQRSFEAILC